MLRFNIIQIKLILIIFCSNAWTKNFDIDIIFESGFVFESQNIFISNIKNTKSKLFPFTLLTKFITSFLEYSFPSKSVNFLK